MNRMLLGYSPDFDIFDDAGGKALAPNGAGRKAVVFDTETTGKAAELLNVAGRSSLTALLGRLVRSTASASGHSIDDAVANELVKLLLVAARHALRGLGAPGSTNVDPSLSFKHVARFFGIELEGLSPEDKEFELARRFVLLTTEAVRHAALAPKHLPPAAIARRAAARAARRYAPGWVSPHAQAPTLLAPRASSSFAPPGRRVRHGAGVTVPNP
ncbi:MAG: hypothetical protein EOP82_29055 [Variovorax sp.]|nr:MAG: hypothetical protein EOP82_29055 [Variovorax sp.]